MIDLSTAASANVTEAVARLADDRTDIINTLMEGRDPGPLTAVEPTTGDPHQGGRRVLFLHFAEQADPLVYKPRSLTSSTFYANLVDWLNERLPQLELATAPTLPKTGYGWAKFVRSAPCRTAEEAARFYYRQGTLLALLHATNGTDVHADNLIARGDQPILVDTETLLHPALYHPTLLAADPALVALGQSVHQTILLPTLLHSAHGTSDISGLGGHGEQMTQNRPVLDGVLLEPADHLPELLHGFGDAYDAISSNADSFIELLEGSHDTTFRVVVRPTRTYAELLETTSYETLASAPTFEGSHLLLEHEYLDLRNGDIPIFFGRPGSRSLWTSQGVRVDDVLDVSGLDSARTKVRNMNKAERRRQEWIIDAAFATATGPISHQIGSSINVPGPHPPLDPQWTIDQAVDIARQLDELAYRDRDRVNWLSLEPLEDGYWCLLPAGGGLAHGYTGVALFLAQLGAITGQPEFLERAAETIAPLPKLLDAIADLPEHLASIGGGFAGMGGIVYALTRLSALLTSPELAAHASAASELTSIDDNDAGWRCGASAHDDWLDRLTTMPTLADLSLCHGELGILDALETLARHQQRSHAADVLEQRAAALPQALKLGARLVGTPRAVATPGLLHGLAGTGYGMLRVGFPTLVPSVLAMELAAHETPCAASPE